MHLLLYFIIFSKIKQFVYTFTKPGSNIYLCSYIEVKRKQIKNTILKKFTKNQIQKTKQSISQRFNKILGNNTSSIIKPKHNFNN